MVESSAIWVLRWMLGFLWSIVVVVGGYNAFAAEPVARGPVSSSAPVADAVIARRETGSRETAGAWYAAVKKSD